MTTAELANSIVMPRHAAEAVTCAHCGLQVPRGLINPVSAEQFCCQGCRGVYQVLHACGLESYYKMRDSEGVEATPPQISGGLYAEFDDPRFAALNIRTRNDGLAECEFYLTGLHCAACVWLVERLPRVVPGVVESRLDFGQSLVRVAWDSKQVATSRIARALDGLGYPPHAARGSDHRKLRTADDRRQLVRIAIAGAASGNAMLIALALYAGYFEGMEPIYTLLFRWVSMLIGIVSLAWPGSAFFRGAWAAIRTRTPHLDLPIAMALGVGGIAGVVNTITGQGEIYFDSITALIFLLLVGRFIQQRQQRQAAGALQLLFALTPGSARQVDGDEIRDVPIEALQIGDTVEVRAGESMPTDGRIISGRSTVDLSLLTGESRPVAVGGGDTVCAGTVNLESVLRVRVDAVGEATRVGRLMQLVERCSAERSPSVQFADRMSGWFVLVVTLAAAAVFASWWPQNRLIAVDRAVAMLIVACPCALGLAMPLVLTVAIGRAARRGILIKGGEARERLATPGKLFLDKTGTITQGRVALMKWRGPENLKRLVAAVEATSSHPIARAFTATLGDGGDQRVSVAQVRQHPGGGIEARVNGRAILIGSPSFAQSRGVALDAQSQLWTHEFCRASLTPVIVALDGVAVAAAGFADAIRPDARESIAALQAMGYDVAVLSGDQRQVVTQVAAEVGINAGAAAGQVTAEEKLAVVQAAMSRGPVFMVGDGVNDAAALAAATAGIAVHGGAEASLAAADVYLNRPGLAPIVELVGAARQVRRVLRRCFVASLTYNTFAIGLAAMGLIHPLIAAALMPLSSFTVVALVLGTRYFGGKSCR